MVKDSMIQWLKVLFVTYSFIQNIISSEIRSVSGDQASPQRWAHQNSEYSPEGTHSELVESREGLGNRLAILQKALMAAFLSDAYLSEVEEKLSTLVQQPQQ